jgi:predicted phosphodiesterase
MSKVLSLKLPRKDEIHSYIVASDWHDIHLNSSAYDILKRFALRIPKKQRRLIILGDFVDLPEFMPRNKDFKRHVKSAMGIEDYFLPAAEMAMGWANDVLDELQKIFPVIIFASGNHDWRLDDFGRTYSPPEYRPYFNLKARLRLRERNIPFVDYNCWIDIGRLSLTHGMYHGTTCCKKHYEAAGRSVIFGHVHKVEARSFTRRGDTVMAWSLPCMANLSPDYLKGRENAWTTGFGVANMRHNGKFNFNVFTIWDDMLVLPNGQSIAA